MGDCIEEIMGREMMGWIVQLEMGFIESLLILNERIFQRGEERVTSEAGVRHEAK